MAKLDIFEDGLVELLDRVGEMLGRRPEVHRGPWRPGDQRYYCSDHRKLQRVTGWRPTTTIDRGLEQLREWLAPSSSERRASGGADR